METTLHHYYFNLADKAEKAAWKALCDKLIGMGYGPRKMHSWGENEAPAKNETETVEIDPMCLFENQWNTTTSRVFDWFQQYEIHHVNCARGHWLEITDEMQAARLQTVKCGYCGKHYGRDIGQLSFEPIHAAEPEDGFCAACLDSPYLKESELYMLRLRSLAEKQLGEMSPLNAEERAMLLPRYVERQTTGSDSRAAQKRAKEREDIEKEYAADTYKAKTEHDGKLWLWEHNVPLDNVIYYSHTDVFSFGWRSPLSPSVKSRILDIISEFPFAYEIKEAKVA